MTKETEELIIDTREEPGRLKRVKTDIDQAHCPECGETWEYCDCMEEAQI